MLLCAVYHAMHAIPIVPNTDHCKAAVAKQNSGQR